MDFTPALLGTDGLAANQQREVVGDASGDSKPWRKLVGIHAWRSAGADRDVTSLVRGEEGMEA